jgi:monoamine oxidase
MTAEQVVCLVPGSESRIAPKTMVALSRRSFLASSVAVAAHPALAIPVSSGIDVIIVGAGAAGIAAARSIFAAGRKLTIFEASDRVGGRCFTDMRTFGIPYDRGAHWIHTPETNPVARLGLKAGLDIYAAPPRQQLRLELGSGITRDARDAEMEDFLANLARCRRAIDTAARGKTDVSIGQVLPKDLGDWRATMEFMLGPFRCGKGIDEVSAMDLARSEERDVNAICRQGVGTLLAKLAAGLPIRFSTPVKTIDWGGRWIEVQIPRGDLRARAVIITVSTGVLAAGKIRFDPPLPRRHVEAIGNLGLGSYDHVAIEFAGNPLGLEGDDLVFEKATGQRTAALLANLSGSTLCFVDVAGQLGAGLVEEGETAMVAFALDWLASLYGSAVKQAVRRTHATRWNKEPWVLGAASAAAPGGQWARRALSEPLRERVWFAGEAVHENLWGTIEGAWEAGERAAGAVLQKLARG